MAGIPLTDERRSQLLESLLAQQSQQPQGIRSAGSLAARLGAQLIRQKQIKKLQEQERTSQQELVDALGAGQATSGQAVTLEDFEGGSGRQQVAIPGRKADPRAQAEALSKLPPAQQLQALQLQGFKRELAEPTRAEAATTAFERRQELQTQNLDARDRDLTRNLDAKEQAQFRDIQAKFELQTRAINAKRDELAAKPNKFTQNQWIAAGYGARAEDAGTVIDEVGDQFTGVVSRGVGLVPSGLKFQDRQRFDQAKRNFINAQLRRESGAVISEQEFENADLQYFPQPGDKEDVLKQKAQNRSVVIQALKLEAGDAFTQLRAEVPLQGTPKVNIPQDVTQLPGFDELSPEEQQKLRSLSGQD